MTSPSAGNLQSRKRRHSMYECDPSTTEKRTCPNNNLESQSEPDVKDVLKIMDDYNKDCNAHKSIIVDIANQLLKVGIETNERIHDFIPRFEQTKSNKQGVKSGYTFLKELSQNIVKNLEDWSSKVAKKEEEFERNINKHFSVEASKNMFNLSLRKSSDTEYTQDDLDLLSSDHRKQAQTNCVQAPTANGNPIEHENQESEVANNIDVQENSTNPYSISEENENDDCDSIHSFSSERTVLNEILSERVATATTTEASDKCRLCEKTGFFIEPDIYTTDVSEVFSDTDSYIFDITGNLSPANSNEYNGVDDENSRESHANERSENQDLFDPETTAVMEAILSPVNPDIPNIILTNIQDCNDINEPTADELDDTKIDIKGQILSFEMKMDILDMPDVKLEIEEHEFPESFCNVNNNTWTPNELTMETPDEQRSKINYLNYLDLKSNVIVEDTEDSDVDDNCTALNTLINTDDYNLNVPHSLSSLGSSNIDTDTSEESDNELNQIGRVINCLPSLPHSESENEETNPTVRYNTAFELKECKVELERLRVDSAFNWHKKTNDLPQTSEENEINRLTNLETLDTVKIVTASAPAEFKKPNYGILSTKSHNKISEDDLTDYDSDSVDLSISGDISMIEPEDFSAELNKVRLNTLCNLDKDDEEQEILDSSHHKLNQKKNNKSNDSDKENNGATMNKELTAEEIAKRKWRNDKLLRGKLTDSDTDSENESNSKTKEQQEKSKTNSQTDQDETDFEKPPNDNHILIDSDSYDSEIEFVSEVKKKKTNLKEVRKVSTSIDRSDSDAESSSDDSDTGIDESEGPKKGRRNIRAILSDETLEEATKKAVQIENERKERLSQKQKAMDNFLSQAFSSESTGLVLDVDHITEKPIVTLHHKLTKRLKQHQEQGVRFMWESCYEGVKQLKKDGGSGCILAHCMGLGKTFQVVALIHALFAHSVTNTKHVLVVCPLSIVLNWNVEFKIGLENLNDNVEINIYYISESFRTMEQRMSCVHKWKRNTGVLIMGYEAYQRLTKFKNIEKLEPEEVLIKKALVDPGPDLVILDEGHLLKNGKINRTQSLMQIKTKRRIVLTGTPLQNNLKEYYYMVQFVKPNLLGSYHEYANRFVNPIINGQFDDSTAQDIEKMKMRSHVLHKMLKATIQRYEVAELRNYLPARYDYAIFIELHPVQIDLYKKYIDIASKKDTKISLFCDYHILQCISTHPYLLFLKEQKKNQTKKSTTKEVDVIKLDLDPDVLEVEFDKSTPDDWWKSLYPQDTPTNIEYGSKFRVMLTIIHESERIGDKVLIFASSLVELDAIEHYLQQNETEKSKWRSKEDYYRMDGAVAPETRLQLCNSFNNARNIRTRVFLISHKVGGLGLNLVAANRVILMDVNWNPAVDNQSVFRSYRFGQTKQCYVYRLVAMGTMEQVVYDRQVTKSAIARRVVDEKQISRRYKKEELEDMYRVKFHLYTEKKDAPILPEDSVLKRVLIYHTEIAKYHEHNALLENRPDEQLDENQMKLAWEEYHREQNADMLENQRRKVAAATAVNNVAAANSVVAASAAGGNPVTAANAALSSTFAFVRSFLPSTLTHADKSSMIHSAATSNQKSFNAAFNTIKNTRTMQPKPGAALLPTAPVASTSRIPINTTNQPLGAELKQKFSEWAQHNGHQVVMPKIKSVTGGQPQSNNIVPTIANNGRIMFNKKYVQNGIRSNEKLVLRKTNAPHNYPQLVNQRSQPPALPSSLQNVRPDGPAVLGYTPPVIKTPRNLGYSISPDQIPNFSIPGPRPTLSNKPRIQKDSHDPTSINRNIPRVYRASIKNVTKPTTTNQLTNNGTRIIEIGERINHPNTTMVSEQQALITSLQRNLNITLSTVESHNSNTTNNNTHKKLKSNAPSSSSTPAVSITHQKTSRVNNGIIEID